MIQGNTYGHIVEAKFDGVSPEGRKYAQILSGPDADKFFPLIYNGEVSRLEDRGSFLVRTNLLPKYERGFPSEVVNFVTSSIPQEFDEIMEPNTAIFAVWFDYMKDPNPIHRIPLTASIGSYYNLGYLLKSVHFANLAEKDLKNIDEHLIGTIGAFYVTNRKHYLMDHDNGFPNSPLRAVKRHINFIEKVNSSDSEITVPCLFTIDEITNGVEVLEAFENRNLKYLQAEPQI